MKALLKLPDTAILGLFLFTALLFRIFSFFYSCIDQDETSYLIIARELVHGATLYTDVWDTKPAGIFLLFAAFQWLFGDSILMIRSMAALFSGLTAFFIFLSVRRCFKSPEAALWTGLFYLVAVSIHKNGLPANTEIFFNAFTALSLFILLKNFSFFNASLAGLLMGMAFMIKYFILPDYSVMLLFLVLFNKDAALKKRIQASLLSGIFFLLPFLTAHLVYVFNGHWDEFIRVTYLIPRNYPTNFNAIKGANFFLNFLLIYAPLVVIFILSMKQAAKTNAFLFYFGIVWMMFVWILILIPGKFFFHYYLQALIPLCFFGSAWTASACKNRKPVLRFFPWFVLAALIYCQTWQYLEFMRKPDYPYQIASELKKSMHPDETLYVDYNNAVYYLLHKKPPVKYVHQTLITHPEHVRALGIDRDSIHKAIADQKPHWLVIQGSGHHALQAYIAANAELYKTVHEKNIRIYRIRTN